MRAFLCIYFPLIIIAIIVYNIECLAVLLECLTVLSERIDLFVSIAKN